MKRTTAPWFIILVTLALAACDSESAGPTGADGGAVPSRCRAPQLQGRATDRRSNCFFPAIAERSASAITFMPEAPYGRSNR